MMRYLLPLLSLVLLSAPATAQTMVSKETANAYFENCVKASAPSQEMSVEGQQMLCACTAARLTQFFTMEDWQAMTSTDANFARPAYNKMMINIYAPCMGVPTQERYLKRCAKTSGMNQQICNCTAEKIAQHLQDNGSAIFENILARNAAIEDPWAALENDPGFNTFIDSAGKSCLPQ